MAFKKRRLIQAISDRPPGDDKSLMAAIKKEIWPFLQQVRRLLRDAEDATGPSVPGDTTVIVNEGDTINTTVVSTTINPSPLSDHLVKARTVDATAVGGLYEKTAGDSPIACQWKLDADNVERLHIGMTMSTPDVTGYYLRLTGVLDPLLRAPVRCIVGEGMVTGQGGGVALGLNFTDQWEQIAGAAGTWTWRKRTNGRMQGATDGGGSSIAIETGWRVLVPNDFDYLGIAHSSPYVGIYEVLDQGSASTPAMIRRSSDANTGAEYGYGTVVQITGDATANGYGTYWKMLTAGTPSIDVTNLAIAQATYVAPNEQQLLTDAEYRAAALEQTPLYVEWDVEDNEAWPPYNYFDTNTGYPGVSVIAAGVQRFFGPAFWVEGYNAQVNPGDTFVGYRVIKVPAVGDMVTLFDAYDSAPLTASTGEPRLWQLTIAETALLPTDRIRIIPIAKTTCKYPVTVHMQWNDPANPPYWETTMQLPSGAGVRPAWSDILPRGSDVRPFQTVAIDANGNAPLVFGSSGCNFYAVTGAGPLKYLPTPAVTSDQTVEVALTTETALVQLQHAAGSAPTGCSALYLQAGTTTFKNAKALHKFMWRPDLASWLREGT